MDAHQGALATVLVVEDDPTLCSLLAELLTQQGYRALTVTTGEEALHRVGGDYLDLVLLDLMLPGIDGLQVLQEIRARPTVPVLVLSARTDEEVKIVALDLGADDYVTKPFSLKELLVRIKAAIRRGRRSSPPSAAALVVGALRIEIQQQRVFVGEQPTDLSVTETRLLVQLATEPTRVFSHRELLRDVWDREETVTGRKLLHVTIHHLRTKLAAAGAPVEMIQTIPGQGYQYSTATMTATPSKTGSAPSVH